MRQVIALAMVCFVVGCGEDPFDVEPEDLPLIETDDVQYVVVSRAHGASVAKSIRYVVTNRLDVPLHIEAQCLNAELDRLEGEEWVPAWSRRGCPLGFPIQVKVEPGEAHVDSIRPSLAFPFVPGTYRVRLKRLGRSPWDGSVAEPSEAPAELRVSNVFELFLDEAAR